MASPINLSETQRLDEEKRELEALLASGAFNRAPNLRNFLEFICQKYFEGKADEIKEYSIAVAALNRREGFSPQADAIVRVTALALRRRLEEYYGAEGADHRVHIIMPTGQYVPRFEHRDLGRIPPAPMRSRSRQAWWVWAASGLLLIIAGLIVWQRWHGHRTAWHSAPAPIAAAPGAAAPAGPVIRYLPGRDAHYVDTAGQTWSGGTYCQGGTPFSAPSQSVEGTYDQRLFDAGLAGKFKCSFPLPAGDYELHLYFADLFNGKEATRLVGFTLNGGPELSFDEVDDAGASDVADEKIYTDIRPAADGRLHLNFITADSFVNAIELVPGVSGQMLPIRILAGRATYTDQQGRHWLADRFFRGGRTAYRASGLPAIPDASLFEYERFGHFSYWIPVVAGSRYTLKLYFHEAWFGRLNGGPGGVGSRIFDVYCNGTTLLHDFDVLAAAPDGYLVKTFHNLQPTPDGKLELFFTPNVNYPLVNAIAVTPEPASAVPPPHGRE